MKRIAYPVALLMLVGAVCLADDVTWKKYTSEGGGYSILLPKEPTEQSQEVNTALGPIKIRMAVAELNENYVYLVSVNDYPEATRNANADNMLEGAVKGGVGDGKLISSDKITYKDTKIPGRDVIFIKQGLHARMHIYLAGVRLYQVMVLNKEDTTKTKETEKYFESFDIKSADK